MWPAVRGLAVLGQANVVERAVLTRGHDIAHLPPEITRQLAVVGRGDDAFGWEGTQEPGWEATRGQLGLAVPRRHEHHQPIDLAASDGL